MMAAYSSQAEHTRSSLFSFLLDTQPNEAKHDTVLPLVLKLSHGLNLFADEKANVQNWTGHINQCLGATKTRLHGLSLLSILIKQCSTEVINQNCATWVRLLMQILQSHENLQIMHLASSTLANVLHAATDMAELSRDLSTNHIPGMISALLGLKPHLQQCCLPVLSVCLKCFPGPCGPFKNRLDNYLVSAMQSPSIHISQAASRCFALLPRVGGGGLGGIKHTDAWNEYCDRLLHAAHGVLEQLYQDVETDTYPTVPGETLELTSPPDVEPQRTTCLVQQFEALCKSLQHLLEEEFPADAHVPLDDIVTLCCRCLGVTGKMVMHRLSTEMTLLSASIPALHIAVFSVLTALITSCRGHLIPQGQVLNKLFIQALAWTQAEQGRQSPYSTLRHRTYQCLHTWLEVVGTSSGLESVAETLLEQLLVDARQQTDITKLAAGSVDVNANVTALAKKLKKSKKGKQKGQSSAGLDIATRQRVDLYANSDVCAAALKVLQLMFLRLGMLLKPAIHKDVHEFAVPLLLEIQRSPDAAPIPYADSVCREALYRLLLACALVPHAKWPAPLHCIVRIFGAGRQDTCIKVSSVCAEAAVICSNLLHPRVPSLHSPMSIAQIESKPKEIIRIVSHTPVSESIEDDDDDAQMAEDVVASGRTDDETQAGVEKMEEEMGRGVIAKEDESGGEEESEEDSENDEEQMQNIGDDPDGEDTVGSRKDIDKEGNIIQDDVGAINSRNGADEGMEPSAIGGDDSKTDVFRGRGGTKSGDKRADEGASGGDNGERDAPDGSKHSQGGAETKSGSGKRKREEAEDEVGSSYVEKKKAPAEMETTTDEMESMLSTFVDSHPDSD